MTTGNEPLWYIIAIGIGAGFTKLLSALKVGDLLSTKVGADKDCKQRVSELENALTRTHTSLTLISNYLENPENLEATKENLKIQLEGLDPFVNNIKNNRVNE